MNQILISEKVYVTPELKRKKKAFKVEFFLSVFFLCILSSYAIYAEYDRTKSEAVSKELLDKIEYSENRNATINFESDSVKMEDDVIIVTLNNALEDSEEISLDQEEVNFEEITNQQKHLTTPEGIEYSIIGEVNIPSINVNYPIILPKNMNDIDVLLKISICKFHGAKPNEVGNLCIVGHNYHNSKFFSKVPNLENGDIIEIKDLSGRVIKYGVYDKYIVEPEDVKCTSQLTNGRKEITLITCTLDNKQRYIIKAREIK